MNKLLDYSAWGKWLNDMVKFSLLGLEIPMKQIADFVVHLWVECDPFCPFRLHITRGGRLSGDKMIQCFQV